MRDAINITWLYWIHILNIPPFDRATSDSVCYLVKITRNSNVRRRNIKQTKRIHLTKKQIIYWAAKITFAFIACD